MVSGAPSEEHCTGDTVAGVSLDSADALLGADCQNAEYRRLWRFR